MNKQVKVW